MPKLESGGEPTMEEILASIRRIISEEPQQPSSERPDAADPRLPPAGSAMPGTPASSPIAKAPESTARALPEPAIGMTPNREPQARPGVASAPGKPALEPLSGLSPLSAGALFTRSWPAVPEVAPGDRPGSLGADTARPQTSVAETGGTTAETRRRDPVSRSSAVSPETGAGSADLGSFVPTRLADALISDAPPAPRAPAAAEASEVGSRSAARSFLDFSSVREPEPASAGEARPEPSRGHAGRTSLWSDMAASEKAPTAAPSAPAPAIPTPDRPASAGKVGVSTEAAPPKPGTGTASGQTEKGPGGSAADPTPAVAPVSSILPGAPLAERGSVETVAAKPAKPADALGALAEGLVAASPAPPKTTPQPDTAVRSRPAADPPAAKQGEAARRPVRSLEDTVAEMLRPMLREWLDSNMPHIVEKCLREEMGKPVLEKGSPEHS